MPSYYLNLLTISGDNLLLEQFRNDIKNKDNVLDFDKMVPNKRKKTYMFHGHVHWIIYPVNVWEIQNESQSICYKSAWEPPTDFYLHVSKRYPALHFKQEYCDEEYEEFGMNVIQNGKIMFNIEYDENSRDAKELYKRINYFCGDNSEDDLEQTETESN